MCKFTKTLFSTDADMPKQASIYVAINDFNELVIEYLLEDENTPSHSFRKLATVDSVDTLTLAKHYNSSIEDLPQLIYNACGLPYDSTHSYADEVFQEALNFILETNANFKLKDFSY